MKGKVREGGRSVLEQPDKDNDDSRLETKSKTMNVNDMGQWI